MLQSQRLPALPLLARQLFVACMGSAAPNDAGVLEVDADQLMRMVSVITDHVHTRSCSRLMQRGAVKAFCVGGRYDIAVMDYIISFLGVPQESLQWDQVVREVRARKGLPDMVPSAMCEVVDDPAEGYAEDRLRARIIDLEAKYKTTAQRAKYWERRYNAQKLETTALQEQIRATQFKRGRHGTRFFSIQGAMKLALQRNMTHASALQMGLAHDLDVSAQTIRKFEIQLRASRISSMGMFYRECYGAIDSALMSAAMPGEAQRWCVAMHGLRADATNSRVWHNCKLHVTEAYCKL